jgi:chloride channel protein, CIC family
VSEIVAPRAATRWRSVATAALGGLLGGLVGGILVVGVTLAIKTSVDFVLTQSTWLLVVVPLVGLALAVWVLRGYSRRHGPRGVAADITGEVVDTAGEEEHFRWRLAPIRALAVLLTVGSGGAMGTEAPAAYLGVATGAWLGDRGRWWRRLLRPAALGGGAAGVSALMGIALVGTGYMLELGRRHRAPLDAERVIAALAGGFVGWGINIAFHLNLIRLIVPKEPPGNFTQAVITALFIGAISGAISSLAGAAIDRAKKWKGSPGVRLAFGGLAAAATAVALVLVATPPAAVGAGGTAIVWAENTEPAPWTLLAVALLLAASTTATAAAGGCGGVFVPFLAIGDIAGRVFAPRLGVGNDLAGSAGAAGGIAGGYRLPFTAMAMVLGVGGPRLATLTCLATVVIASLAGVAAGWTVQRVTGLPYLWMRRRAANGRSR